MEIVLLGATGSLGGAIREEFLNGLAVHTEAVLHFPSSSQLNLFSRERVESFFASVRPDVVIDATGQLRVKSSQLPNLQMTRNLLRGLASSKFQGQLVRFGSILSYGTRGPTQTSGFKECEFENAARTISDRGSHYYARDKTLATLEGVGYVGEFTVKNLILSNLYVPERLLTTSTRTHVVPSTISRLSSAGSRGDKKVQVPSSLVITREFTHVGDISRWVVSELPNFSKLPRILNLGSGQQLTIGELNNRVSAILGFEFLFQGIEGDPSLVSNFSSTLDSTLARKNHQWAPRGDVFAELLEEFPGHARGLI